MMTNNHGDYYDHDNHNDHLNFLNHDILMTLVTMMATRYRADRAAKINRGVKRKVDRGGKRMVNREQKMHWTERWASAVDRSHGRGRGWRGQHEEPELDLF